MHMADALVSPNVAGVMALASTLAAAYSVKEVKKLDDSSKIPVMGVMGALVFATQMINFTIPGTGSSGHLCGGMLVSAILGPSAGFLTMIGVLLIQCLLFADGGLLALGCNVWNMAFYGCFLGSIIWKFFVQKGATKPRIILASVLGCVLTLQLGAFSVTLQTLLSGITELPFGTFIALMQPIHLAIGFVEGLITAAVLCFIAEARPSLLWGVGEQSDAGRFSLKQTLTILTIVTVMIAGGLSLFASSHPDGLEWSMEKVAGTTELEAEGGIYDTSAMVQEYTSLLPDYAFKDSESAFGTSFSGIVGSAMVILVCVAASYGLKLFKGAE